MSPPAVRSGGGSRLQRQNRGEEEEEVQCGGGCRLVITGTGGKCVGSITWDRSQGFSSKRSVQDTKWSLIGGESVSSSSFAGESNVELIKNLLFRYNETQRLGVRLNSVLEGFN
ncbi:unnamed protein product [Pleuronectes platessa]|uniref:Uncharacterized protein n=1 Tax=Pleuronectes platessa TaxID=8262 RepID=A0A9N7YRB9_PLEPL|nr:unnamed protein product [Pleuronectes platessa]